MLVMVDSPYYLLCYILRPQHHGIMEITTQESRINKSWPDVCKADIQPTTQSLLFKSL